MLSQGAALMQIVINRLYAYKDKHKGNFSATITVYKMHEPIIISNSAVSPSLMLLKTLNGLVIFQSITL